jgi:hypothetical protein
VSGASRTLLRDSRVHVLDKFRLPLVSISGPRIGRTVTTAEAGDGEQEKPIMRGLSAVHEENAEETDPRHTVLAPAEPDAMRIPPMKWPYPVSDVLRFVPVRQRRLLVPHRATASIVSLKVLDEPHNREPVPVGVHCGPAAHEPLDRFRGDAFPLRLLHQGD